MDNNKKGEIAYALLINAFLGGKIVRLPLNFLYENEHIIEAIAKTTGISVEEAADFLTSFKRDARSVSIDIMIKLAEAAEEKNRNNNQSIPSLFPEEQKKNNG